MNGYVAGLDATGVYLGKENGTYTPLASAAMPVSTGSTYRLKVVAVGTKIAVYVNDMLTPKISAIDTSYSVGQVGLRSHYSHAHFDNFIERPTLAADFSSVDTRWVTFGGIWSVTNGAYDIANGASGKAIIGDPSWSNYTIDVDLTPIDSPNTGVVFRVTDPGTGADAMSGYIAGLAPDSVYLGKDNGSYTGIASAPLTTTPGSAHHLRVTAYGSSINIFVDDMTTPKLSVTDASFGAGQVGLRSHYAHAQFDNFLLS
jgi:hypothetical protein